MAPFFGHYHRSEGWDLTRCYLVESMAQGERKSFEPMPERANASELSMNRLLTEVKWDEQGVVQEYRRGMVGKTSDFRGVLMLDDTAFPKKGKDSDCVARQY
jgi:SRSO17 transposase